MQLTQHLRAIGPRYWVMAAYGWIAVAALWLPAATPLRVTIIYLFALAGPGFALSGLITRDAAERWVLTIALSGSLAIVVSVAMAVLCTDSMPLRFALLAAVTSVAALSLGIRAGRDKQPTNPVDVEVEGVRL